MIGVRHHPSSAAASSPPVPAAPPVGRGAPVAQATLAGRTAPSLNHAQAIAATSQSASDWAQPPVYVGPVLSGENSLSSPTSVYQKSRNFAPAEEGHCADPADGWSSLPHHKSTAEVWQSLKEEAREQADKEPALASFLHSSVIGHASLESSLSFILANKLSSPTLLSTNLMQMIMRAYTANPEIVEDAVADMQAVHDRDPASAGYLQVLLFFKGFHSIQSHRIAHHLWHRGRRSLAYALQSRMSQQFDVDIHPAAYIGRGVMMDHATGIVIGETAVIGDNVSMLHRVTIGGSGISTGLRHPTIGHGVLLGAGTTVIGPIHVGHSTKVGAGSVVVQDIPEKCVAVGVPAKVIRQDKKLEPCLDMDQAGDYVLDFAI